MELARKNPHSAPVHAIMTDAHTWYFFGLQSVQKGSTADLQAGDAGGAAGGAGVQGAGSARGLEFSFGSSKEAFRLFDCAVVYAEVLGRNTCSSEAPTSALRAVEASVAQRTEVSGACVFQETNGAAAMEATAYCPLP